MGEELTYSEDAKVVVNKVLRDDELRRVREFWEYLRRSPDYRTDYNKLSNPHATILGGEDIDAHVRFCQKWKIQFPLNPRLSFDQIIYLWRRYENLPLPLRFRQPLPDDTWEELRAPERIREVLGFVFDFEPGYSDAAFVDSEDEIVDSVYLNVWIDLKWPEECILTSKGEKGELKKILDAWFPERRSRWAPTSEGPVVVVGEKNGSFVQLLLNCTASKSKILSTVKPQISELHSGWDGQREDKQKLYDDVLRLRLLVYDMIEGFMREQVTATEVATLLNLTRSTVNRYHEESFEAIPGKSWGTKRPRKQDEYYEAAYVPCYLGECPYPEEDGVKKCSANSFDACPEARDHLNQGLNEKLLHKNQPSLEEAELRIGRDYTLGDGKRSGIHTVLDENDREVVEPSDNFYILEDWHRDRIEDDGAEEEDLELENELKKWAERRPKCSVIGSKNRPRKFIAEGFGPQWEKKVFHWPRFKTPPPCSDCSGSGCQGSGDLCERVWDWCDWIDTSFKPSKAKVPKKRYEGLISDFSAIPGSPYYPSLLIALIDHRKKTGRLEDPMEDIMAYPLTLEIREKSYVCNRWGVPSCVFWSLPLALRLGKDPGCEAAKEKQPNI